MIELIANSLVFSFPEVHPKAKLQIDFQKTLRIPDDGQEYFLPPGLGRFPLRHVDDFAKRLPKQWSEHGGVMLPMYQSEAMWINFSSIYIDEHQAEYPFAVKIATGKINVVTGSRWDTALHRKPQDYLMIPEQPWLDGYCVEKGLIRQFVAMPLGEGYTVKEQLTRKPGHGGLQVLVYPMKREAFERHFPKVPEDERYGMLSACMEPSMGLAAGGKMKQEIYRDIYPLGEWDQNHQSKCFVHIANSALWRSITGEILPTLPPTAKEYTKAELPWFDYYSEGSKPLEGSAVLGKINSVFQMGKKKGSSPLPENESVAGRHVVNLGYSPRKVREGIF